MKYLHTSMMGSYNIDCELIRNNGKGKVEIKYIDLVTDEEIVAEVPIEDVMWEMKDRFDHTIEISVAEGVVMFNKPVVVGYYPRYFDEECHNGMWIIYYEYDFGMSDRFVFDKNVFMYGIKFDWDDAQIVKRIVEFDLAHAFDHPDCDPNYNHTHWALYGNLKDRFEKVLDPEFDNEPEQLE